MASDTPEVRLARLEEQLKSTEKQVDVFGPVARQVLEAILKLEDVTKDIQGIEEWRKEIRDLIREVERSLERQILACSEAVGEVKREIASDHKAAQAKREQEADDARDDRKAKQEFRQKVILSILGGAFLIAVAVIGAIAGT